MKKLIPLVLLLCGWLAAGTLHAQTPQKFSYQAVAVDAVGNELKNAKLCLRASILKTSFNGIAQWVEVHSTVETDDFGLFTIEIGGGQPISGVVSSFDEIAWGDAKFFLKIEMSIGDQCTNYILVGTNQLLSVPYALYAEKAAVANIANYATYADSSSVTNVANVANYATYSDTTLVSMTTVNVIGGVDTDSTNELQNLVLNGSNLSLTGVTGAPIDLNASDPDHDPTNELQNLQANGSLLTLSGSAAPPIDLNAADPDHDPTNELQNLMVTGTTLTLSGSSGPPINLSVFNTADPDADPTNELQNLSVTGSSLTLTGSTAPPIDLNASDPDHDPTNELQNLIVTDSTITLTGVTTTPINVSIFNNSDPDHDPTNELQNLQANGSMLTLSNSTAAPIDLNASDPDHDPTNEIQDLVVNGTTISLTGGSTTFVDIAGLDPDHDPTNELQNLQLSGSSLTLSGSAAPPIDLNASDPDHDPTNELQQLTFDSVHNHLSLTNSTMVINLGSLANYNAAGADLDYPQGVSGSTFLFLPDTYVVPADSVLYIVASEDEMILPGVGFSFGRALTSPNLPVFKPGTSIDECRCIGFLKKMDPFFQPVSVVLKPNQANFYQVPFERNFVIKSGLDQTTPITLNGFTISPFGSVIKALVIPEGIQIKNLGNDEVILTGYLFKK